MEVVVPATATAADFIFDSTSTTPYVSAPSSPRPLGEWPSAHHYYTSAPTSPTRAAAIFREFSAAMAGAGLASPRPSSHRSSVIPFEWGDAPGTPKSPPSPRKREEEEDADQGDADEVDDFAFEFSGQLEMGGSSPLTADELFEEGMIRPLKPPPRLQFVAGAGREKGSSPSPRSPRTPKSPKSPRSRLFFGRRGKDDDFDPFAKAIEETTRGRERANSPGQSTGPTRRAARSLSPLRGMFDFGHKTPATRPGASNPAGGNTIPAPASGGAGAAAAARWIKGGSKKWRLRDLLLFRSASEGRATGSGARDPLRKYTALSPFSTAMLSRKGSAASISSSVSVSVSVSGGDDTKNASFRSTDSGSVGGGSRRGSAAGSAHGRHYAAASRAAAEDLRRRTMLPYRQGLFGCLGFNPAINGLARGFSSSSRTRS